VVVVIFEPSVWDLYRLNFVGTSARKSLIREEEMKDQPVTRMFEELIKLGHITPSTETIDTVLPGAFRPVPSVVTYDTPNIPVHVGVHTNAKLGQHS
jgi:hypothetical protein